MDPVSSSSSATGQDRGQLHETEIWLSLLWGLLQTKTSIT
jgi:hypothetical protein